jgi:radical SAM protein with 4Fe4S-binding SPASM domain
LLIHRLRHHDAVVRLIQSIYHKAVPHPRIVQLHINTECNFRCDYCYSTKVGEEIPDWLDIIRQASALRVSRIEFLGGEPLLAPQLEPCIAACDRAGMAVTIFTTGTLLSDERVEFLRALRTTPKLVFKFDERRCYEQLCSPDARHYEQLLDAVRRSKEAGLDTLLNVVVSKKNTSRIPEILERSDALGVTPTFERYMPAHDGGADQELALDASDWNSVLKQVETYYSGKDRAFLAASVVKGNSCSCYMDLVSIDVNGNVLPCPFAAPAQRIGNVNEEPLQAIWSRYPTHRAEWMEIPADCRSCDEKLICHGGCRTATFARDGSYDGRDPLCNGETIPTVGICGHTICESAGRGQFRR